MDMMITATRPFETMNIGKHTAVLVPFLFSENWHVTVRHVSNVDRRGKCSLSIVSAVVDEDNPTHCQVHTYRCVTAQCPILVVMFPPVTSKGCIVCQEFKIRMNLVETFLAAISNEGSPVVVCHISPQSYQISVVFMNPEIEADSPSSRNATFPR